LYTFGTDVATTATQAYNTTLTLSNGAVLNSQGSTSTANGVWIDPTQTGKWAISVGDSVSSPLGRISLKDSQNTARTANIAVPVLSGQAIEVLYASSGDASRTLGVAVNGTEVTTFASSASKNVYLSGKYTTAAAGTLTVYSKGSGMYVCAIGVGVAIPKTTEINNVLTDKGVSFNGSEVVNTKGLNLEVYNMLGKKVATSKTNISTTNFQKGIYVVRVTGTNDSLKFSI
jgi:Secretion system C-terminal sorting domain